VDRHTTGRAAEARARDIVRRHGAGTLDYFALRSDKQRFFHRDSVVAYAIYGGVCLVSPDPIGPPTDRAQTWAAFRRFADSRGWVLAIMGASEDWLPLYRATGMHEIYIGDEAVVDVQRFSLAGGHMKGLRQAANRIAKYGYTATFHDPSTLAPDVAQSLAGSCHRADAARPSADSR
jgi:lysyl-tRNA synthetase class 2